jgi:hypothetical protein
MCVVIISIKMPYNKITLPIGTKIKILPLDKSTIFLITKEKTRVEVIKKYKNFIKIIINNKVGWIYEKNNS